MSWRRRCCSTTAGGFLVRPYRRSGSVRMVSVTEAGLTSVEAARRLERDGGNLLPTQPRVALWRRIANQVRDPLVLVLLAAAALTILIGDWADATVIMLVVVVNTTVGV